MCLSMLQKQFIHRVVLRMSEVNETSLMLMWFVCVKKIKCHPWAWGGGLLHKAQWVNTRLWLLTSSPHIEARCFWNKAETQEEPSSLACKSSWHMSRHGVGSVNLWPLYAHMAARVCKYLHSCSLLLYTSLGTLLCFYVSVCVCTGWIWTLHGSSPGLTAHSTVSGNNHQEGRQEICISGDSRPRKSHLFLCHAKVAVVSFFFKGWFLYQAKVLQVRI